MINEMIVVANASPASSPEASPFQFPIMMLILFAIMYFLMIRPQKRREKERKEMLENVKSGSRVLLTSGLIGQVTNVKENTVVIRIAENTKVEAVRAAISQILEKDEIPTELDAAR
ncbi:MAG: preprotein translocase subunit YajC [Pontiellaceae bacterium]|nr:preprotein translocase subunit YajC [Kiritimatiellaceae bacterium]HBO87226.1 preprotein translocase subunit YajC [Verrucomicrobiota bacterium]|tara:strand:+ start:1255 stop:1602 length:348 start_codon:yes stop_codon:yes gene_type:complete